MPKNPNQKQKLIRLAQILGEQTDENHALSTEALIEKLAAYGISAERKSIYSDIETLISCGYDIERKTGKEGGYYIASRTFELAELKLLVDAVQSSRFITHRKSDELIHKVENLTSCHEAQQLQRQVYVSGRIKTMNESIYYNVDSIHSAITTGKKIAFQYFEWVVDNNMKITKRYRHEGARYEISPWALTWNDENYYMIGFDSRADAIRHYRVDKMEHIETLDMPRDGSRAFSQFDMAVYTRKLFGMFHGEEQVITLRCTNRMIGVIRDSFGSDISVRPDDGAHFRVSVPVAVSPQLFGWLSGLGDEVQLAAPQSVAEEYVKHLEGILRTYQKAKIKQ